MVASSLVESFGSLDESFDSAAAAALFDQEQSAAYMQAREDIILRTGSAQTGTSYEAPQKVSEFVRYRVCYDFGKPIQFHTRPWRLAMYDSEYTAKRLKDLGADGATVTRMCRQTLEKTARQCEKSTSLGNKLITYAALLPNVAALYVSSAGLNMMEFADERVANVIRLSPLMGPWIGRLLGDSRYYKRFEKNNSRLLMRSAHLNADRIRGIPADILAIDEIQNFIQANIPIIEATLNVSTLPGGPITLYCGTPLSFDNPIERIWSMNSTQNLWGMSCLSCGRTNFPPQTLADVERMISPAGMICVRCCGPLDVLNGKWIRHGRRDADFEGFHLSRAMMPYTAIHNPQTFREMWAKFYRDVHNPTTDEASIMNEIFGVSFDAGAKPIKREELIQCCVPGLRLSRRVDPRVLHDGGWPVFAGIDWGEGTGTGAYTVVVIGHLAMLEGRGEVFMVTYARRYMHAEASANFLWDEIAGLLESNGVSLAICDAGMGFGMIDGVRENLRDGISRLVPMRYTNQSAIFANDAQAGMFTCNRTRWMARMFTLLKRQRIALPSWEQVMEGPPEPDRGFAQDILTIYSDRSPRLKQMQFNHSDPDDFFHALLYAVTAQLFFYGDLDDFAYA